MAREYEVLTIDQLTRRSATGGIEPYYRYRILTSSGTSLTVDISEEDYTPEKAAPILLAAAQNTNKMFTL